MPTIKEKLSETIKSSMKSGDKTTLGYARSLHAAIRKKEIDDRIDLDDDGVQKIISTLSKQRKESIDQFKQGGREDLVAAETQELSFLMSFMPEQMGDDELKKLVDAAVAESGAAGPKDMGKVMKVLLPKVQGRADGKKVSEFVKAKLG